MVLGFNPEFADVNFNSYTSAVLTIGTSAVQLYTGGSPNEKRQVLMLYNDSSVLMYLGPATVTVSGSTKGIPLLPKQFISIPIGGVPVYAIAGTSSNNLIIQELA